MSNKNTGQKTSGKMCLVHSVTNMKFRYERISEYIHIEKNNTNEYPNIFVSKKQYERISEYIRIKKMIRTNIRIYSYKKMIRI